MDNCTIFYTGTSKPSGRLVVDLYEDEFDKMFKTLTSKYKKKQLEKLYNEFFSYSYITE